MDTIQLNDRFFQPYFSEEQIQERVSKIAEQLMRDFVGKEVLFLGVLNGSFMFFADLMRLYTGPCTMQFVKVASYEGTTSTGIVKTLIGLNDNLEGKHVVIIEDIVDSGYTMFQLLKQLNLQNLASLSIATFLYKPSACKYPVDLKYIGFEIPEKFVVGYGLDYNGAGRNLPCLYEEVKP